MELKKLFLSSGPKYSWKKVFCILFFSTAVFFGAILGPVFVTRFIHVFKLKNGKYHICAIVQRTPHFTSLPTTCLAEILRLSADQPSHLLSFDLKQAEARLLETHFIKSATLRRIKPNILFIEYKMRQPIALLGDRSNTAIDEEGVLFPLIPFYSYKTLPELYLGNRTPERPWGKKLEGSDLTLLLDLLKSFQLHDVMGVDFSHVSSESAGKRECIVHLKDDRYIRLPAQNHDQEMKSYCKLEHSILREKTGGWVVDLRIPDVAYIQEF